MKSFTIYEEYFDLITILPTEKEQQDLLFKISEYMFYDKKPELNDNQMKIFRNLKRPLDISKQQSKRRIKQEPKENRKKTEKEPKENTSKMSMSMSMSNVYVNVINKLNSLNNSNYKTNSENTIKLIKARLDEGYTEEDLLLVVEKMSYLWNKEPKRGETDMRPYLRPSTLFRKSNFENYLNMPVNKKTDLRDVKEIDVMEVFK